MAEYLVSFKTVYTDTLRVYADSEEEALEYVRSGIGEEAWQPEYEYVLPDTDWEVTLVTQPNVEDLPDA